MCSNPTPTHEACGVCSACVRAAVDPKTRRSKHPDIVVLERALYEPAQIGRRTPENQDLSIDQVRTLVLSHASYAPHEGRARVFVIRRAEEMNASAANALLKTLEEPISKMHFVLLTSQPDALLPTIRSRVQRVRFGPLSEEAVITLLLERSVDESVARRVAPLAGGSLEAALDLCDAEATEAREAFVTRALAAIDAPSLSGAIDLGEQGKRDKVALRTNMLALASRIADVARKSEASGTGTEKWPMRYAHVLQALEDLDSNASPQLVIESMVIRMR